MLHVTADHQRFTLPTGWDELTLGQFFGFLDSTSDAETLAALSGVDLSVLRGLRTPELTTLVADHLSFLSDDIDFESLPVPKVLTINNLIIIPPRNLGEQTLFGQKADIDAAIKVLNESGKAENYVTMARVLLTTYLFPLVSNQRYESSANSESILHLIDSLPVTDALPLSAFFDQLTRDNAFWSAEMQVPFSKTDGYAKQAADMVEGINNYDTHFAIRQIAEAYAISGLDVPFLIYDVAMTALAANAKMKAHHLHFQDILTTNSPKL